MSLILLFHIIQELGGSLDYPYVNPYDFPSGENVQKIEPGSMRVRVVKEAITYNAVTYTQGQELLMPRDTIYENPQYRGKVERVSGYDVPK